MKKISLVCILALAGAPAFAATSNPFSPSYYTFTNTDFVVALGLLLFIGILLYFKVPGMLGRMLDDRATTISAELDEAKTLREEAQALLTSYERKQAEVQVQADRIVASAKEEAEAAAEQAKADISASVARRVAAAEEQIAAAEAAAVKEVRDHAVIVAIGAAQDMIAKKMTAKDGNSLIDDAIAQVGEKLH
ncbi:MAG: F0F1 ATP synthase subunit B [Pseudomonadota bacterium]